MRSLKRGKKKRGGRKRDEGVIKAGEDMCSMTFSEGGNGRTPKKQRGSENIDFFSVDASFSSSNSEEERRN